MAVLDIVIFPDPRLRQVSRPVEEIDDRIRELVADMQETMYVNEGAGLAAIQVGAPVRVFIADPVLAGGGREDPTLVYINPKIVRQEGEQDGDEGCLSFPGVFVPVGRPAKVTISATGLDGEVFEQEADGILARAFCHETEHLDGELLIDKVGRLKAQSIKRKLKRAATKG